MASMLTRLLSWPALAFTFATWVVFLAGIACLQRECGVAGLAGLAGGGGTYGLAGAWGWSPALSCNRLFRFFWFMIAFLFVTLIGAFIAAGPKYGLSSSRPFWVGMFAINTLLFMIASEATLAALDSSPVTAAGGQPLWCMRTAAAGAIMTVVGCIFLLMTIGTDWEGRDFYGGDKGQQRGAGAQGGVPAGARRDELPVAHHTPAGAGAAGTYQGGGV